MLGRLVAPAVANARAEAAELEASCWRTVTTAPLQPWDWAYYAERVRRERFAVDAAALRPYFELRPRRCATASSTPPTRLYGLSFSRARRPARPTTRTCAVFEVPTRTARRWACSWPTGTRATSKRGGAWMSSFVDQSHLLGTGRWSSINLNMPRPAGRRADAAHPRRGAHGVPRVRARPARAALRRPLPAVLRARRCRATSSSSPRQVNEMWAWDPEVLARLRRPPRDRRTAAAGADRRAARRAGLRRGLRDHGVPRGRAARPGVAPPRPGRRPVPAEDVDGVRGARRCERNGIAVPPCRPAVPHARTSRTSSPAGTAPAYYSYIWSEVLDADTGRVVPRATAACAARTATRSARGC